MKTKASSNTKNVPTNFDPSDPDAMIAAVVAIIGHENLARGPQAFGKTINTSPATIYRKMAEGKLRAKLLDSKPLIPFWEQVRFIASLPDWKPIAQRRSKKLIQDASEVGGD